MERIFIDKDQGVASIVERILACPGDELVLVVPKNADLKSSISNFHILKREAAAAEKSILIESVDAEILALAEKAHVESFHPLFRKETARSLSDIVPQSALGIPAAVREGAASVPVKVKRSKKAAAEAEVATPIKFNVVSSEDNSDREEEQEKEEIVPKRPAYAVEGDESAKEERNKTAHDTYDKGEPRRRLHLPRLKTVVVLAALLAISATSIWVAGAFFGRARVNIEFRIAPFELSGAFTAGKTVTKVDAAAHILPAEVLNQKKTLTQFFPASGRATVSQKATGRLTIYNAYSSQAQSLVAMTRFVTPEGKVFRLDSAVTVPGAEIKDGKIIPSSMETSVTADKAGADYNVGPADKITIPGFQGGPKYTGFYGSLKSPTTGGFVGERATPSENDIKTAREKITSLLETSLKNNFLANRPDDLLIPAGASELTITKTIVNKATDDKGNFSIIGEAELKAMAFRESDLRAALMISAGRDPETAVFRDLNLKYENAKANIGKGEMILTVTASGRIAPAFDPTSFKTKLLGRPVSEARSLILGIPELVRAEISLWPIWLGKVPEKAARVEIMVN
ncbi:MAG: hypothetical protein AAB759_02615 [Patescibacteria group bacterium]